jgi:transcriptional regulator with XRE-family HTH domain
MRSPFAHFTNPEMLVNRNPQATVQNLPNPAIRVGARMSNSPIRVVEAMDFDREAFGRRLRDLREGAGEDQKDVAELLSLSISSISNYEAGESAPNYENLAKLVTHYDVSVTWLLFGQEGGEHLMSKEAYDLFVQTAELPQPLRRFVVLTMQMAGKSDLPAGILTDPTPENWLEFAKTIYESSKDKLGGGPKDIH